MGRVPEKLLREVGTDTFRRKPLKITRDLRTNRKSSC